MKGKRLSEEEMKMGDVLLFQDVKGSTHFAIAAGQSLFSHRRHASANVTHAGIYDGAQNILESSGAAGLRSMKLIKKHKGYKFQVYRLISAHTEVAKKSVTWTNKLIKLREPGQKTSEGFGRYDTAMAAKGIVTFSRRGRGASKAVAELIKAPEADRGFYCSNFVVECYELACDGVSPVIDVDFRKVTPKILQANLRSDSKREYKGNFIV